MPVCYCNTINNNNITKNNNITVNNNKMENLENMNGTEFEAAFGHFFDDSFFDEVALDLNDNQPDVQNDDQQFPTERAFRSVDVNDFLESSVNANTKKKTDADIKFFNMFLQSRNEMRCPEFIPPDMLNDYISEFLLGATKCNGQEYEPTTLRGFVSSIDRHLKSKNSKMSIINDIEFSKACMVLKGKQKQLKSQGYGNKPKTAEPLLDVHLQKMYAAKTLGDENPRALIHSLWLVCTTHFGMRTGNEIHSLRWGDIQLAIDDQSGEEYLMLDTERQTKTRTGANPKDTRVVKPKAFSNPEDPARDPVHLYKLYSMKRPAGAQADDSPFFLVPGGSTQKCWYRNSAMGLNKIYKIMSDMKQEAGIEAPRITPYSARKRLIQKLSDDGVPANQIVQISGHKNVNSLNSYSKINNEQSKKISNILSDRAPSSLVPASTVQMNDHAHSNSGNTGPSLTKGFFLNSNFHGNVTFNFHASRTETQQLSQQVIHTSPKPVCNEDSQCSPTPRRYKRIRMISESDSE